MTVEILNDKSLKINDAILNYPISLNDITKSLGENFRKTVLNEVNNIYTFDELGIYIHANNEEYVEQITMDFQDGEFNYFPKRGYQGGILIFNKEVLDYDTINNITEFIDIDRNEEKNEGRVNYYLGVTCITLIYNTETEDKEIESISIWFNE
jgi:hypothetical protein